MGIKRRLLASIIILSPWIVNILLCNSVIANDFCLRRVRNPGNRMGPLKVTKLVKGVPFEFEAKKILLEMLQSDDWMVRVKGLNAVSSFFPGWINDDIPNYLDLFEQHFYDFLDILSSPEVEKDIKDEAFMHLADTSHAFIWFLVDLRQRAGTMGRDVAEMFSRLRDATKLKMNQISQTASEPELREKAEKFWEFLNPGVFMITTGQGNFREMEQLLGYFLGSSFFTQDWEHIHLYDSILEQWGFEVARG